MTDVLERSSRLDAAASDVGSPPEDGAVAPSLRYLLAALAGAAGVIHLAMVPSHIDEWAAEGVAFAVAGWLQLALAVGLVVRPTRALLGVTVVANAAMVAAWAVTRTAGAPFGPHSGHAEDASLVDLTTVGFEVVLVLGAGLALLRPGLRGLAHRAVLVGVPAVLVLGSVALASPSARNHAAGSHGEHGDAADGAADDGHGHGADDAATAMGARPDDRGLSELRNGHHHEMVVQELDADTQAALDEELAVTREVAAAYPTVADALAAGYRRIGPYFPGIGAHFGKTGPEEMNEDGVLDDEALRHPFAIIYTGTEPTARVAGFMYLTLADAEPEGFAGPNDFWHVHEQLCLKYQSNGEIDVPFGLDHEATEAQCDAAGARIIPLSPWMVHVWSAPGWDDDPEVGTFGEFHTDLTCSDGTYHMLPIEQWVDHPMNVCRADAA